MDVERKGERNRGGGGSPLLEKGFFLPSPPRPPPSPKTFRGGRQAGARCAAGPPGGFFTK
ncbi:hypothetical protein WCP94_001082 [Bilophila wadsworthia]